MKKILIFIVLVLLGLMLYFLLFKNITHAPVVSVLPVVEESDKTEYIEFDLSYPEIPEGKYLEMANFLKTTKENFINDFGDISKAEAEFLGLNENRKYSYIVNTKTATSSNTVSYILEIYNYTGGAHGITGVTTFTYNNYDKLLTLRDIFIGNSYLDVLSEKSYKYFTNKFKETLDDFSIKEGTRPNSQNFASWYMTDQNIVFIFGQYSIGPYALGIQEFSLPKSEVEDILNPDYR